MKVLQLAMPLMAAAAALTACSANDPAAQAARDIEAAADNRADAIRAIADENAGDLGNKANAILANVIDDKSYEGRVAQTRAEALKEEAELVKEQGRAKARAEASAAKAQADAIRAR